MKKHLILIAVMLAAILPTIAQDNRPGGYDATAFKLSNFVQTIIIEDDDYVIPSPLIVEVWNNGVKLSDSTDVTVSGDTIRFTLTPAQLAPLVKVPVIYLKDGDAIIDPYLLAINITVKTGYAVPNGSDKRIYIKSMGNIRIAWGENTTAAMSAASRATAQKDLAVTAKNQAVAARDSAIATLATRVRTGTMVNLRAITETMPSYVIVGDRAGVFYYDPTDTTSPDDSAMVIRRSDGKRFKRTREGFIRPEWFGAVGNGTTDDYIALQRAVNYGNSVLLSKIYATNKAIVINKDNFLLAGLNQNNTGIVVGASFDKANYSSLIEVKIKAGNPNPPYNVTIQNCYISAANSGLGNDVSGIKAETYFNLFIHDNAIQGGSQDTKETAAILLNNNKHCYVYNNALHNSYATAILIPGTVLDGLFIEDNVFDESQSDIVIRGFVQNLIVKNNKFGNLIIDNIIHTASVVGYNLYVSDAGSIGNAIIVDNLFSGVVVKTAIRFYSLGSANISRNSISGTTGYAIIVDNVTGKINVSNNTFTGNASGRASSDPTASTANSLTSPYKTDIFLHSAFHAATVKDNLSTQAVIIVAEPLSTDTQYLNTKFINNATYSYGKIVGIELTGTAPPTTKSWLVGEYMRNTAPAELGSSSSKYIIEGWRCIVSGAPGTWVQVRAFTGN